MNRVGSITLVTIAATAFATGCTAPTLSADDTVIMPGRKSPIRVVAYRPGLVQLNRKLSGVEVVLYVDGKEITRGPTDKDGYFDVKPILPKGTKLFEARATVGGKELKDTGRVFAWPERTIVIVDVDETISNTDFKALLSGADEDVGSTPLPNSVETLKEIDEDFNICFVTARPREVLDKTKRWMERHAFPAAPVISSETLGDVINQQRYKRKVISDIKEVTPNVLIGIGDKVTDSEAYGSLGLLTIVITEGLPKGFRAHGILMQNWEEVGDFFQVNRKVLRDPEKLAKTLETSGLLMRPTIKWAPLKGNRKTDAKAKPQPEIDDR